MLLLATEAEVLLLAANRSRGVVVDGVGADADGRVLLLEANGRGDERVAAVGRGRGEELVAACVGRGRGRGEELVICVDGVVAGGLFVVVANECDGVFVANEAGVVQTGCLIVASPFAPAAAANCILWH